MGRDLERYEKELAEFEKRKANTAPAVIAKYEAEKAAKQKVKEEKVAKAKAQRKKEKEAAAKKRAAQGLAAVVQEGGGGLGIGLGVRPPWGHPPRDTVGMGPTQDFVNIMKAEASSIYDKRRQELPTVNVVGYSIPKTGKVADFLKGLKRAFPGSRFTYFGKYQNSETGV